MVRRVEWCIEQASTLRQCFPEGECLCSAAFAAAGVEGLQLVFYPSGYAGARDGHCSYFLQCPPGSVLRCSLWAGKQRREARLAFEQPGFFGRTNFCRFDHCVDAAQDTLMLALEIEEAQHTVSESMSHQPSHVTAATRSSSQRPQSVPTGSGNGGGPLPEKIDSTFKLQRNPGRDALDGVLRLPSIWTCAPQSRVIEMTLDGFQTFEDLKAVKKPGTPRLHGGGAHRIAACSPRRSDGGNMSRYAMYTT
mmetsp:Transcript_93715/g.265391  ORF Transcript_93715/g.265391 Transcript_93715/m.265391 type:complete len:250 (-) Transcript_93715:16-765(-)